MKNNKDLSKDMIDVAVGSIFAGVSMGVIHESPLTPAVKTGAAGLIGAGLLKKSADKLL